MIKSQSQAPNDKRSLPSTLNSTKNQLKVTIPQRNTIGAIRESKKENNSNEMTRLKTSLLVVTGMTCSACVGSIESHLMKLKGVMSCKVTLLTGRAEIVHDDRSWSKEDLMKEIDQLGYEASLPSKEVGQPSQPLKHIESEGIRARRQFLLSLIFAIPIIIIEMVLMMLLPEQNPVRLGLEELILPGITLRSLLGIVIASGAIITLSPPFIKISYASIRYAHTANMATLVVLGVFVAYFAAVGEMINDAIHQRTVVHHDMIQGTSAGSFEVPVMLLCFVLLGKYLESRAKRKTLNAVESLLNLQPKQARLITQVPHPTLGSVELEQLIDLEMIQVDDLVKVLPGDNIPCDGVIELGESEINEQMITGEPLPKFKTVGHKVTGGTINVNSPLKIRVTQVGEQTLLQQIINSVQSAQSSKPPLEILADRVSSYFVPIVVSLASLVAIIWGGVGSNIPEDWLKGSSPSSFALTIFVSMVVIACPCALGLASPAAVMVGTGLAAKYGILVPGGGATLETAHLAKVVVFDKTGTLTVGQPKVNNVVKPFKHLWDFVYLLESSSSHPIAKCLTSHAKPLKSDNNPILNEIREVPGKGVIGKVNLNGEDYHNVVVGTRNWLNENGYKLNHLDSELIPLINQGFTLVFVGVTKSNKRYVSCLTLQDQIRPEASLVIEEMKKLGMEVWMLTGDTQLAAERVGKQVGITNIIPEVLPTMKAHHIQLLQANQVKVAGTLTASIMNSKPHLYPRRKVMMVGDGINDAPALAQSDVGVAIGTGTDTALASAHAILLHPSLLRLLTFLSLSRTVTLRIRWNFLWALGYNTLALPIAAGLLYPLGGRGIPPALASLLMITSSLSVLTSSLLLPFTFRPPSYTSLPSLLPSTTSTTTSTTVTHESSYYTSRDTSHANSQSSLLPPPSSHYSSYRTKPSHLPSSEIHVGLIPAMYHVP